jgi:hypothetical protein
MSVCFISDVHSQYDRLQKAVDYAESQNLQIIFLGDLFDSRVDYSDTFGTLNLMYRCIKSGHLCVNSNHQDKLIRYLKGNKVVQNNGLEVTVRQLEENQVNKTDLLNFLSSFAYGIVCKNSHGKQFRVAHAYFPNFLNVAKTDEVQFFHGENLNRKAKNLMIYGPTDRDNLRTFWWNSENNSRDYIKVAGHYHTVHVDDHSVIIDSGCGSGGCLSLYVADTTVIKEF